MKSTYLAIVVLTLVTAACNSSKKMHTANNKQEMTVGESFDTQGHRGCRGLMPENTIPAMMNALGLGVTTLEMDVVITKDKQVVLSHEPFFNHEITTKPDGGFVSENEERALNIYQMNYSEVLGYDVGLKPHPRFTRQQKLKAVKPLLADVFDSVRQYMMTAKRPYPLFNIETKCSPAGDNRYHPEPNSMVDLLVEVIRKKDMQQYVTIQSFDFRSLQYLHKQYPGFSTAMLIEDSDKRSLDQQLADLGFVPTIYSPHYSLVTETLINACHARKMKVIPWTVNKKEEIDRLKKAGVDGIISDYPDLF